MFFEQSTSFKAFFLLSSVKAYSWHIPSMFQIVFVCSKRKFHREKVKTTSRVIEIFNFMRRSIYLVRRNFDIIVWRVSSKEKLSENLLMSFYSSETTTWPTIKDLFDPTSNPREQKAFFEKISQQNIEIYRKSALDGKANTQFLEMILMLRIEWNSSENWKKAENSRNKSAPYNVSLKPSLTLKRRLTINTFLYLKHESNQPRIHKWNKNVSSIEHFVLIWWNFKWDFASSLIETSNVCIRSQWRFLKWSIKAYWSYFRAEIIHR